MKKILAFAMVALIVMGSSVMAADTVMSGDIKEADGTSFQNTNTGSGVKTGHIQDNAVTAPKINNGAVTTEKIKNDAVTAVKIAPGAVVTGKIADTAVTSTKIADNAVTTVKMPDGAVTGPKLGANAVSTAKIADGAVTASKLNSALYTALLGTQINVYDKNNLLLGPVLDSAQFTESAVYGNQLLVLMKTTGNTFFGVRAGSKFIASVADVHYSNNGCSGSAYSTENFSDYLIQPAHVGFYPGSGQLYSFIQAPGIVGQITLYRSTASYNSTSNIWVCTTHSAAYSATLYALTAANSLASFVAPFHVGQ